MNPKSIRIDSVRGGSVLVSLERGEFATTVRVNDAQIMFKIRGRPWTVGYDVDNLADVADAAAGALLLTREGSQ
ncbi:hypothetical protein Q6D67_20375 [Haliea sp. E1-2-M8]|uniref:hypothetical protein n=1 Tax=Haliea sp. E1-2-M8 TaxID=3064706 RepID=UPI0027256961|nr:hypothetical protein [Haliea sp. E1-2-M8]MDO8864047.1 hypothetical protein [Haliea sp. E1-2-M8]